MQSVFRQDEINGRIDEESLFSSSLPFSKSVLSLIYTVEDDNLFSSELTVFILYAFFFI